MENEIELKLLLPNGISAAALNSVLTRFSANVERSEFTLFNQYFDTPDNILSAHGIGLRVRSSEKGIEQTVKTAGKTLGGLHQRPEYNVQIDTLEPNLELFDPKIWPDGLDPQTLQKTIRQVFHTDFKRTAHFIRLADGADIELALDQGEITTADDKADICEIELELKSGSSDSLFELAEQIVAVTATQLGNISKAGRGFLLARHAPAPEAETLQLVHLKRGDSCEQAFLNAMEYVLSFWQKAEYRYMQQHKYSDLSDIYTGMRLADACVDLYRQSLECEEFKLVAQMLDQRLKKWNWLDPLLSMKNLRSRKSMYAKRLLQHDPLISYLRGLQDGTLNLSQPRTLITEKDNVLLQLKLTNLVMAKPWRKQSKNYDKEARLYLTSHIAAIWNTVLNKISRQTHHAQDYIKAFPALRLAIDVDTLTGACFSTSRRESFCPAWRDILEGLVELKTIKVLQNKLHDSDMEDKSELLQWSEVKKNTLLSVIEQSKNVALESESYW